MTTTPEMTLLNYCEIHGHAESARILRAIVEKQRTPHSDTDAHPENQGSDLFAANAGAFDKLSKEQMEARDQARANHNPEKQYDFIRDLPHAKIKPITPEQARYAYDSALEPPTQAIPCDSRPLTASDIVKANEAHEAYWREHDIQDPSWCQGAAQLWYALSDAMKLNLRGPKHRWIYSDGTPRQEPCCR